MSWAIFKVNVLKSMQSFEFATDTDSFAEFFASEYDRCIKRGGDVIYGVPVLNGNLVGMTDVIKAAFKKGQDSYDENYNVLEEIYPAAFDAYWLGAEMAPIPNPLLKPGGWLLTPPAPGAIKNIGPNPIMLAASAALHKAEVEATQALEDNIKGTIINIPEIGDVNVYDSIQKILNREPIDLKIKNHPSIKAGKAIIQKVIQAKNKKPSIGTQIKKAINFPFPQLPKKREIIENAKKKLLETAVEQLKEKLMRTIEAAILSPIIESIERAIELSNSIPTPKPTKDEIKKFVKDTVNGAIPDIQLPEIDIPIIPSKEELKRMVEEQIPTKEELEAMAYDLIEDKIPKIPNIWYIPPTIEFNFLTNIMINPFVNVAKVHLTGVSGVIYIITQYPPPAPPGPAVLNWSGYFVPG